ncbi:tRNA (adenosine(37)-N6)-dimethylallyltransferase MiaA [Actibacterium sp. 188UL27-1]|uniref:tRNA (adenosine(37)-N6)-dimethylallyltransferase MiaA n=1 Tax=Actibacterium sp. 188UL27-1 TaxID=2786961 RepID=UPI00195BC284|nr:tRNA (adenosine(37)-N6)-dimethylallyltransferase MiaA [Actibacterium sp. 188UL27-1]MBM7067719.1 tRNA (adenosine(37)-N6)-dimethylallyltransferase MiaA [Actibacterium sp. 188UL27-1]
MDLSDLDTERPVLIAGPTASGKSALALRIAQAGGGVIVNADALQVFANWRILTARPSQTDEAAVAHHLYGHVPGTQVYSAGGWLREVAPFLTGSRAIIVGGTGLNFAALTQGLADIPAIPPEVRAEGDAHPLPHLLAQLDPRTRNRIDTANRARVQRAWEVLRATGRPLTDWQEDTGPPLLPLSDAQPLLVEADRDWLAQRIARRFDQMIALGALEEARANLPTWDPSAPSAKAIGARELIAHLKGEVTLDAARDAATVATRQYAKRQRTWFRARMKDWHRIDAHTLM